MLTSSWLIRFDGARSSRSSIGKANPVLFVHTIANDITVAELEIGSSVNGDSKES